MSSEHGEAVKAGSWAEVVSARYAAPAAMFTLGIGLHAFNAFIASTTMPSAAKELGAAQLLSWATSAYLVASIAGGVTAASFKARWGSRAVLIASSLVFIVGTLAAGFAGNVAMLVAGRALQGAGEGVVLACCYVLIPVIFPKALVPRIFALESIVWVSAALGGPSIAGAITEVSSWRAAVLVSVPVSIVFMILVPLCVPANGTAASVAKRIAWLPLGLIVAGVALLSAHGSPWVAGPAVAGAAVLLTAAAILDARGPQRLFPARAFDVRDAAGAGLVLVLLMSMAEAPAGVFVAFAGQEVWSLSVLESGFLSAIIAISWSLTAIAVAHMPRWNAQAHIRPAAAILACGLALLVAALQFRWLGAAIAGQVVIGAAFGFSWARLCEHVMDSAREDERDFAVAALPTIQSVGLSIGAALAGTTAGWFGLEAGQPAGAISAALVPVFAGAALLAASALLVARRAA